MLLTIALSPHAASRPHEDWRRLLTWFLAVSAVPPMPKRRDLPGAALEDLVVEAAQAFLALQVVLQPLTLAPDPPEHDEVLEGRFKHLVVVLVRLCKFESLAWDALAFELNVYGTIWIA